MNHALFSDTSFDPWWWEWAPRGDIVETPLPDSADVVVVGSGYTGLMAALTLARAGREVVVCEAERIGFGASTRNGGQVGSGNQRFTVKALTARYGEQQAHALIREGIEALDYVKSFIQSEAIECHLRMNGRFRGASKPEHYEAMARDMEDLKRVSGVESHMVSAADINDEIGSHQYYGGSVLPADCSVHPALYHQGLVDRALAAGVSLQSRTRVTAVEQSADGATVATERGALNCNQVLIATNGYTTPMTPDLYKSVVPVAAAMVATEELSPNLISHLMPKARVYGDTLQVHHYFQPSPDNKRLLFGGRLAGPAGSTNPEHFRPLHEDMLRVFPELSDVPISHCWSGNVAITRDGLPHIGVSGCVYHAMGYNGSGVARASHGGHQVAMQMLGQVGSLTAWNALNFERFPFHAFSRLGVAIAITWKRWQDRRG